MDDLFVKGHASHVPGDELRRDDGMLWYLPHHGVLHPRKKKLRVVLDASARFAGTSLNDCLQSGPDLTNNLIGVLLRFRQEPVAMMADLECMFYQVRVPHSERDLLRFLWWPNGDPSRDVIECCMHTHIFGATSSPAVAAYALRKTALDNATEFSPDAMNTILESFYKDDCLKAVATVEEAMSLWAELRSLTQKGGFRLTAWVSNSHKVIESIPPSERSKNVTNIDLDYDDFPSEKALGVLWEVESDCFSFCVSVPEKPATKRGIMSTLCSLYDPLGMVAPCLLLGKMILQESCRLKSGWDDEISADLQGRWRLWLQDLPVHDNFTMDWCVSPAGFGEVKSPTLHHFADACQSGYGCISYLRLLNYSDEVHCTFIFAKACAAPLKQLTIPRLELTAATVAVRVDTQLRAELTIPLDDSQYWTDSTSVLGYTKNEKTRFKTFVANRVATIHERSESTQWHYVPSQLNPADIASRGLDASSLVENKEWKNGPEFLWQLEQCWPHQPCSHPVSEEDPDVKNSVICITSMKKEANDIVTRILTWFSDWFCLRRFVPLIHRTAKGFQHVLSRTSTLPDPRTINLCPIYWKLTRSSCVGCRIGYSLKRFHVSSQVRTVSCLKAIDWLL